MSSPDILQIHEPKTAAIPVSGSRRRSSNGSSPHDSDLSSMNSSDVAQVQRPEPSLVPVPSGPRAAPDDPFTRDKEKSSSDLLQVSRPETALVDVPWRARMRAQFRDFLLRSWPLRVLHKGVYSHEGALRLAAMLDGAEYAAEHMRNAYSSSDKFEILLRAIDHAPHNGLFLEFGVWSGKTVNLIAERVNTTVHGFDSFEGLPEDWHSGYTQGTFHMRGRRPSVRPNVTLHVGWFHETLPAFACKYDAPIAFLHVDCDLYSSTKVIFEQLGDRIRPGTVIVFDEYFNYPGWRNHEYRAFQEFVQERSLRYRYLAYNTLEWNVAVQITA